MSAAYSTEEFRAIPDLPFAEVSSRGRIRFSRHGIWVYPKQTRMRTGHLEVRIRHEGGKYRQYVHRVVLEAFVGPCPSDMEACHNDGNPGNNHVYNLRWDTHKNNLNDRVQHGTMNRGSKSGTAKLTDWEVLEIRRIKTEGALNKELAIAFGVTESAISAIIRREIWAHL